MKFYKNLYVTDSAKKSIRKIKWKLKHNAGQVQVFVITLAPENDLLEIYHCAFLQQKFYKIHPPYIIGVAKSYEEALLLMKDIILDIAQKTGTWNIREYLLQNQ